MRITLLTFIFFITLPNLSWAVPVKYEFSGMITRYVTQQIDFSSSNPIIDINDDRFGSSVVTDAIPIGTRFSGSFIYDSDISSYNSSSIIPQAIFVNDEFAIGPATVSIDLPSSIADIFYQGNIQSDRCKDQISTSRIIITDGISAPEGKTQDFVRLEAGNFNYNGTDVYTCGKFNTTGINTGEYKVASYSVVGRERSDVNPDYITDPSFFPVDIDQLINDANEKIFAIGFEKFDDNGLIPLDEFVHINVVGELDFIRAVTVPEPEVFILFGFGLLGVGLYRRNRR